MVSDHRLMARPSTRNCWTPHTSSIRPPSRHILHAYLGSIARSRGRQNGDHAVAFLKTRNTAEHDQNQSVETEVAAEICELVRRDVVDRPGRQSENESRLVASDINSVLQRATANSVQEIDKLITELQAVSNMLHSEASRVQREVVQYSTFTQAALQSTKIIAESLEQWRKVPDTRTLSD